MDFEKSRLERLKRALYSRDANSVPEEHRTPVKELEYEAPKDWGDRPSFDLPPDMATKNNSFFNKFFLIAVIFFVISLGIAAFILFGGLNMISSNNVDIKTIGPSSISSGEELDLSVTFINQNRTDLTGATLFIEYPDGSQSVINSGQVLTRDKVDMGVLKKGESKDYTIKLLLSGEKDSLKTIKLRLEYTVTGSNAVFSKEKNYDVTISSSPLLLDVSYPKEINSGQTVPLTISITSNSSVVVSGVLVKVEYPYGYTYTDSSMKPVSGNNIWNIGDLKNGDKKTLTVNGTLVGQNLEDRSFRVSVGTKSPDVTKDMGTPLATSITTVGIRKSFFDLSMTNSNEGGINQVQSGQNVPINIDWSNTLPDKIVNSTLVAKISGNVFDSSKVTVSNGGFYSSGSASITWDKNTTASLGEISPGENGTISFSFVPISNLAVAKSIVNPHVDIHLDMTGNRTGMDTSEVSSSQDLTVKFDTVLTLLSNTYRYSGPFVNTGSIPPKAENETTYTVTWTVTNTNNEVKNSTVSTILPVGIVWKGETSPSSEKITYDSDTRRVTWNIGNVSAGSGFTYSAKKVYFKVGVTPSLTQVGSVIDLTTETTLTATDTYTENNIRTTAPSVSTRFSDPSFITGNDTVVK